jgi:hypothetical protein
MTNTTSKSDAQTETTVRVKASNGGLVRGEIVTVPLDEHTLARIDSGYLEPVAGTMYEARVNEQDVRRVVRTGDNRPTSATAATSTTASTAPAPAASADTGRAASPKAHAKSPGKTAQPG